MSPNTFKSDLTKSLKTINHRLRAGLGRGRAELSELYKGVIRQPVLFWEDDQPHLYEYIFRNGSAEFEGVKADRFKGGLADSALVFVSGPQVYQRLFKVDISLSEVPEWIISNRHRIWPRGIDDELLDFNYELWENTTDKYLYFCFIKKDLLATIEDYCRSQGLLASSILPRASLLLVNDTAKESGITTTRSLLRGQLIDRVAAEDGFYRVYAEPIDDYKSDYPQVIETEKPADQIQTEAEELDLRAPLTSKATQKLYKGLDFASQRLFQPDGLLLHKIFKACLYSILSVLLILVVANIYLSIRESQGSEVLAEYKIIRQNNELLENRLTTLESELAVYADLIARHSAYGQFMAGLARQLPDSLWLRYLEIANKVNGGQTVTLKGYAVNRAQAAELANALESLPRAASVEIDYLNHVTDKLPDDLPSRYQDKLYRFSVSLEVLR